MSRSQLATKADPVEAKNYTSFELTPLTGSFGATINNIQVADALTDDALFTDMHSAWLDYQVLFFRNQELSPRAHGGVERSDELALVYPRAVAKRYIDRRYVEDLARSREVDSPVAAFTARLAPLSPRCSVSRLHREGRRGHLRAAALSRRSRLPHGH